ncbi:ATP5J2 [Cordylochernes scorpioides]|uniref:ATP5J2 n=1 Tax=Cordylochernes scorpioides TaxID=51811 RepID=A0ABY6LFP5_9ARAC|nr:ATP5J2 [Cordylochernes scorpioides]UYV79983.1 ATP5J2 [Cordylochernes scorpioides]
MNALLEKYGIGHYPKEYNPKIHGVYDPARYYGKPDIPLSEVKLQELPSWLMRRNKSPLAIGRCVGRGYWRWMHSYIFPRKAGLPGLLHIVGTIMAISFYINSDKVYKHRYFKHH